MAFTKWHRSARALGALAASLLAALAPAAHAQTHLDNPFAGASMYVNPDYTASADATASVTSDAHLAALMRVVGRTPTAVWLDRIAAVPSLATHLDRAVAAGNDLALFVLHDIPGRDCDGLVSNGEMTLDSSGLTRYETQFIDAIAAIASQPRYAGLRIVFVVEPDSLANLVTNLSNPRCAETQSSGIYVSAVRYAVNTLHAIPNVYLYLDVAFAGWLGWEQNAAGMVALLDSVSAGFTDRKNALDGFSTNVADFVPLKEPYFTATTVVNGRAVRTARFYQYNSDLDDATYAADLWRRLTAAGWPTTIGMLGDTSRNGWGGSGRPTGPSPVSDDLDRFVDESRVDRRTSRGAWCNPAGAGIGERPQAAPAGYDASHYDAFVWAKPPGQSDGSAQVDRSCDPGYLTPENVTTGALPDAPNAGEWFPAQFTQLVQNMWPVIVSEPVYFPLSVQQIIGGTASGTITSSPAGIRCGSTCTASFLAGTVVTLTASWIPGVYFNGWSGACSGTASTCTVAVTSATTVNATFSGPGIGYTLTIFRSGTGSGTVTSSPKNIECGSSCQALFARETAITLTAAPATGSSFTGWSGACTGTSPTCTLTMTGNQTVGASFTTQASELAIAFAGTGAGVVSSAQAGVSCGASCSASLPSGSLVTLTATAASGSSFAGWSGACLGAQPTCTVSMTAARAVTATFQPGTWYPLGVLVSEDVCNPPPGCVPGGACLAVCYGGNAVTSSPAGIGCGNGGACSAAFASGTSVTLTAIPYTIPYSSAQNVFAGWMGACAGSTARSCVVPMTQAQSVTARFVSANPATLRVATSGAGKVTGWGGAVDCGTLCNVLFTTGTTVTLTASTAMGSTFAGWGGACAGATGDTCKVTMASDLAVTATFTGATTFPLTVTRAGLGTGTVVSTPAGIQCGATCTADFTGGLSVTLYAAPAGGSVFAGWGGACTGFGSTCVVPMTKAQSVTASFGGPNPIFTVTRSGTGTGTVVSTPAGISCGSVCSASIPANAVTLTATAAAGSSFTGWSGGCTGTAATCVLTADALTQTASAVATFTLSTARCTNPIAFTWNTGNFNTTDAACYRTSQKVNGWGCSNFAGRTVRVNDGAASATCGSGPLPLAKTSDGYTYFVVSAGQSPWASIYVW